MTENDAMRLLAEANPVLADALAPTAFPRLPAAGRAAALALAAAAALAAVASGLIGVLRLCGHGRPGSPAWS